LTEIPKTGVSDKDLGNHPWELYNLNEDYSQAHNLADKYPEKLKELQQVFEAEAERNHALPILPGYETYPVGQAGGQKVFTYRAGVERLQPRIAPNLAGHTYTITADVDVPTDGADGVIVAQGGRYGGISLFVKDHRVVYEVNAYGHSSRQLVASEALQPGRAHIVLNLTPNDSAKRDEVPFGPRQPVSATGQLSVNGRAQGEVQFANVNLSYSETLDVGSDLGTPVSNEYKSPGRFTGTIDKVAIEIK
jgi:hypothetical protein